MAGRTAILKVDILSDFRGQGAFAAAESSFARLAKGALALGAAYVGVRKVVDAFQAVIGAASDLQQATGAVNVVFEDSVAVVERFGDKAADAAGMSRRQFYELGSVTGALLKNLGYNTLDAADATVKLAQRGADLSAVFGKDVQQVMEAFNATLRGEFDPIEQVGIKLNETTVKAKAWEMGLYSGTGAIDQNARAQAALALIMEQSAYAAGMFAQESDTYAGATARLAAKWEDLKAKIGATFLPAAANVVSWLADIAMPALDAFIAEWGPKLDQWWNDTKAKLDKFVADLEAWWAANGGRVLANIQTWWDTVYAYISGVLGALGNTIRAVWAAINGDFDSAARYLGQAWSQLWRSIYGILSTALGPILSTVRAWVRGFHGTLETAFEVAVFRCIQGVQRMAMGVASGIGQMVLAGRRLIDGLVQGVVSGAVNLYATIIRVVQNAVAAARRALGIASPSAVFADIGMQIAAGLAQGIDRGASSYVAPSVAGLTGLAPSSTLSGRGTTVTVTGALNPQQTARDLAAVISGATIRTGLSGLPA